MSLKKTLASYRREDGTWAPQEDIEMGPLEEAAFRADWACGDKQREKPVPPNSDEKIAMLSVGITGADILNEAMSTYNSKTTAWNTELALLEADAEAKWNAYNAKMANMPPGTKTC